jgi:hypothetical protein
MMGIRVKNIRRHEDDGGRLPHADLADGIAALLPDGAQFAAIVLLPGGRGRFVASSDRPELPAALRRLLDAAAAGEGRAVPLE